MTGSDSSEITALRELLNQRENQIAILREQLTTSQTVNYNLAKQGDLKLRMKIEGLEAELASLRGSTGDDPPDKG
jgi:hypothetical protein